MPINRFRQDIAKALEDERSTGALRDRILAALPDSDDPTQDCYEIHQFVVGYVKASADLLEAAYAAAEESESLDSVGPFLEAAVRYIDEDADFIPDDGGLTRYIDDAYFVFNLLQRVSDAQRDAGEIPVIRFDYRTANRKMRTMLGDSMSSRIEAAVEKLLADAADPAGSLVGVLKQRDAAVGESVSLPPMPNIPQLNLGG